MLTERERDQHRERQRRYIHRQRAEGDYSTDQWQRLCKYYGNRCVKCGKPGDYRSLEIDHVIPVSKGGTNYIENIQPLCKKCNIEKGNQVIDYRPEYEQDFMPGLEPKPRTIYD